MTVLSQSNFLQAIGWAVLNSLWQMALLWVVYQLITAIFKITGSSQRSALASFLLFAGFCWFLVTFGVILGERSGSSGYSNLMDIDGNPAVNGWLRSSLPIASVIYLVLLILPVLNFIRNYRYVQVIRRYGLKKADVEWRIFVQQVSARMGIHKNVQIWMSDFVSSPLTIGFLKPVILLPLAAINHLNTQQIEAVILHELSHIKRYDYLLNLVSRMIQSILYFNPFVKAFARIIEKEREKNCDEIVMQFQYEPHGYASALLVLEKAAGSPSQALAVAAAGGRKNELLQRVEMIMGVKKKQRFSFNKLAGVMAAILCFIALNALLLLNNPVNRPTSQPDLANLTSPFLLFSDDQASSAKGENNSPAIENHIAAKPAENAEQPSLASISRQPAFPGSTVDEYSPLISPSLYSYVSMAKEYLPQLSSEQELQVKEALDASKKVLEETQWKAVEQNIADVLTQAEKSEVKDAYQKAAEKADWDKMERNLRLAYDEINWKQVNTTLTSALAQIQLDSLRQAYTLALVNLNDLQQELKAADQKGLPDSDITLQDVEIKKNELRKAVNRIKSAQTRKIIRL